MLEAQRIKEFKKAMPILEQDYYGKKILINISKPVDTSVEEYVVKHYLSKGKINEETVCWKAGSLVKRENKIKCLETDGDSYLSFNGAGIKKYKLKEYIKKVNNVWKNQTEENKKSFSTIYRELADLEPPTNLGTIHIISMIYFLSKEDFPIYDRFVHKAVKALYMNKKPCKMYVGGAPEKSSEDDAINVYNEYLWFLANLFDKSEWNRQLDRALWVYGHAKENEIGFID